MLSRMATLALSIWHPANGVARTGLATYNALVLLALLLAWRQFNRSSVASATLFGLTSVAALMAYAVVGAYVLGPQFSPPIASLTTAQRAPGRAESMHWPADAIKPSPIKTG